MNSTGFLACCISTFVIFLLKIQRETCKYYRNLVHSKMFHLHFPDFNSLRNMSNCEFESQYCTIKLNFLEKVFVKIMESLYG